MDSYLLILGFGFVGLLVMAALGAAGGHGHHHGHGADGFHMHATGHHGVHLHSDTHFHHTPVASAPHAGGAPAGHVATGGSHTGGHAHANTAHGHHAQGGQAQAAPPCFSLRAALLGWLSPRVAFTLAVGFGATGALLQTVLPIEPWRALASVVGGVALEKLIVSPLWNALMGFGSRPARTLETAVLEEAVALTNFDRDGCGLITINLDGHEMRVLARLSAEYRDTPVRSGTPLLVESVDAARGSCTVSLLAPGLQLP